MSYVILTATLLAALGPLGIAFYQHRERAREARLKAEETVLNEIRVILIDLTDAVWDILNVKPLDHQKVRALDLDRMQRRLASIVDGRCPDALREPLRTVTAAVDALQSIRVPSDEEVIDDAISPSALGALAVRQFKAAAELHRAITAMWNIIDNEHGA